MAAYTSQSIEGVDLTATYAAISLVTAPETPALPFTVGTRVIATNGSEWIFATTTTSIAQYATVWIDSTFAAVANVGGAGTAPPEGTAGFPAFHQNAALTTGMSSWFMISGVPTLLVTSAGTTVPLYTCDVAGTLSGLTASGSHYQISGVTCVVTASGSTASQTQCVANAVSVRKPVA